jgi:hypothetical protein
MISHGRPGGFVAGFKAGIGFRGALTPSPGLAMVAGMNGFLAICGICPEIMS